MNWNFNTDEMPSDVSVAIFGELENCYNMDKTNPVIFVGHKEIFEEDSVYHMDNSGEAWCEKPIAWSYINPPKM